MAAGWLAVASTLMAVPYVPLSDDEVLERLPPGVRSAELRRQRQELAEDPENLRDSVAMAESYLETARVEGDPRFLGYAQAILSPWWETPSPPAPVLVLRAKARIASLDFARAQADLERVPMDDPVAAGALTMRFHLALARGDPGAAETFLEQARSAWPPAVRILAGARLDRLRGGASAAYDALGRLAGGEVGADGLTPELRHEVLLESAEIAGQMGRVREALDHFAAVRALGRRDVMALASHADLLLDERQAAEVVTMLRPEGGIDPLAVRLLEAWQAGGAGRPDDDGERQALRAQVESRLQARRQRGDAGVLPDEARFRLRVTREPGLALERARELWAIRKELGDARLLVESALAAGQPGEARPVRDWLAAHGIEDRRLAPALGRLGP